MVQFGVYKWKAGGSDGGNASSAASSDDDSSDGDEDTETGRVAAVKRRAGADTYDKSRVHLMRKALVASVAATRRPLRR